MIDRDLAELYGVPTKRLNEAVKRNIKRFPDDFMFKLNHNELKELIANCDRFEKLKHSSFTPNAFTEQGVAIVVVQINADMAKYSAFLSSRVDFSLPYILLKWATSSFPVTSSGRHARF